jgi:hypothetical protein
MMKNKPKKQRASDTATFPRKAVLVERGADERESHRNLARTVTSPEVAALRIVSCTEAGSGLGDALDTPTLLEVLREQSAAVNAGDMAHAEGMLMAQATALQSLFARLSEKALTAGHLDHFDGFMRMALRAQSQCRATLETLANVKNPPVVYARQANVTTGPQQINNGVAAVSHARENETTQTQQSSGAPHGLLQDTRASSDACRLDPALEALGEIDRAKVTRR